MTFDDFDFEYDLMEGIDAMGYQNPTPIQQQAIPLILDHHDLIACAQTGTGKTAAFMLPILNKILLQNSQKINTLILVPTRELALQIDQQIEAMAYYIPVGSIAVYGGNDGIGWAKQKKAIQSGTDIIIATPGRLISLINMNVFDFSELKHLVLDEADRMLDMGFAEDIERIVKELPKERQTLLFSATMPHKIRTLAHKILHQPKEISIAISQPASGIKQEVYWVHDHQKEALLTDLLKQNNYEQIIIFCSSKLSVKSLYVLLKKSEWTIAAFHSDLNQNEREYLLLKFKNKHLRILIGTDVLSRGIDVQGIDLVLNYNIPPDPEDYIHRIGRTARASSTGTAISFINEKDRFRFKAIEKLVKAPIYQIALDAKYGPGPDPNAEVKRFNNFQKKKFYNKKNNSKK